MDRHWLLTWTTYGTWLPGDARGFVGYLRDGDETKVIHNEPATPCDKDMPALSAYARAIMTAETLYLERRHAGVLVTQFQETALFRHWDLLAVAIMRNHVHLVVGVPGDPDPETLLRDFKAYSSRALNRACGKRANGRWWTESGSRRKLADLEAVTEAVEYVTRRQPFPLLTWAKPHAKASGPA